MKSQRYTLARTWIVPLGWTKTKTAREALDQFQEEIDGLKAQGFRVLTPPEVVDGPDSITFLCTLRGPVGHEYDELGAAA